MIIDKNTSFENHPETDGPIRAVIVDVTEPKTVDTKFGPKQKFAIVFETEMVNKDGQHWAHWDHGYTPSVDDRATLRKNVEKMLGGPLPEPFDTESLIGVPVKIIIEHKHTDGKEYANITYYGADKSASALKPSGKFIRQRDRQKSDTGSSYSKAEGAPEGKEDWRATKVHVGKFKGQQVEDLDMTAVTALITHWLPGVTAVSASPSADDRRLIRALQEVQNVMQATAESAF